MDALFMALAIWLGITPPRPLNWQAGMGVIVDVQLVTYPTGARYVSLRFADGRQVEVADGVLYGGRAAPDYHDDCDQITSPSEVEGAQ